MIIAIHFPEHVFELSFQRDNTISTHYFLIFRVFTEASSTKTMVFSRSRKKSEMLQRSFQNCFPKLDVRRKIDIQPFWSLADYIINTFFIPSTAQETNWFNMALC